jgi:hypothetical protein
MAMPQIQPGASSAKIEVNYFFKLLQSFVGSNPVWLRHEGIQLGQESETRWQSCQRQRQQHERSILVLFRGLQQGSK